MSNTRRGRLVIAANSIGCDADIPARTLEMLRTGDLLVFEEDRPARRLLKAAGIHRDYLRHNEHQDLNSKLEIASTLKQGKTVVYVSDQGSACVADPGRDLVSLAYELGAEVKIIPGPSSITAAISACPFDCSKFDFVGFLPREEAERVNALKQLQARKIPQIIMDAPYRMLTLLNSCVKVLNSKTKIFLALDISGPDESYFYGSISELVERQNKTEKKLNFVIILEF